MPQQQPLFPEAPLVTSPDRDAAMMTHDRGPAGELEGQWKHAVTAAMERWTTTPELAFREWKESQRVRRKEFASHSLEQYEAMFSAFLRWLESKSLTLRDAREEHLDLFLTSKTGREGQAASTTRRRYLQLIHKVYEHLRLMELRKDNPAAPLIDLTRHQDFVKPAPSVLSPNLAEAYTDWCLRQPADHWVDARNKALRLIFIASGITVAEARRLTPDDVDVVDGTVQLRVAAHGFVQARATPVAAYAAPAIQRWTQTLRRYLRDAPVLFPARNFSFAHDEPERFAVGADEAFRIVQEAMHAIGYDRPRAGPQTLRNTFIARQIWEGRPHDKIMAWCGLQSAESIQRISKLVPIRADGVAPV